MTVKRRLRSREASEKFFVAVVFVFLLLFFGRSPCGAPGEQKEKTKTKSVNMLTALLLTTLLQTADFCEPPANFTRRLSP